MEKRLFQCSIRTALKISIKMRIFANLLVSCEIRVEGRNAACSHLWLGGVTSRLHLEHTRFTKICLKHAMSMEFSFLSPSYELCLTDGVRNLRLLFLYVSTLFYIFFLSAFTTTGFDCHTSPVFSPANPESSIEDCLAHLGEKVSQELKEHLHKALESLLSKWVSICFSKGRCFDFVLWLLLKC